MKHNPPFPVVGMVASQFAVLCSIFKHEKEAASGNGSKTPRLRTEKGRTMALLVAGLVGSQFVVFSSISKRRGEGVKTPRWRREHAMGVQTGSLRWLENEKQAHLVAGKGSKGYAGAARKMKNWPILWLPWRAHGLLCFAIFFASFPSTRRRLRRGRVQKHRAGAAKT